jgi:HisJ family histidinol phosphate phosphatase
MSIDPRVAAIPDVHGHAKGEHRPYAEERPIPYTARMLFLWFFHACQRGSPRFMMVSDHINFLTFEDPAAVNLVRRALKLAEAGDLYGAAETAGVDIQHAAVVSEGLRRGMRFSIGAEVDNDPRSRPDAINIVEAMRPDAMIRSVHFLTIEHPEHGADWQWPFDNPEFVALFDHVGTAKTWEIYVAAVLDAVEKQPGHILGHFYAPAKFGHWPDPALLETYEDQVLDACATRGMAVEINTRLFYRLEDGEQKRLYRDANLRLMRKAKARGVGIAISSDAHSPKDQGHGFPDVLKMLDESQINELIFPVNGRMARVALRATKEHLEEKAKAAGIVPKLEPLPVPPAAIEEAPAKTVAKAKKPRPVEGQEPAAAKVPKAKPAAVVHVKAETPQTKHVAPSPLKVEAKIPAAPKPKELKKPQAVATPVPVKSAPAKPAPKSAAPKPIPVKAAATKAPAKAPAKKAPPKVVAKPTRPAVKPSAKPAAKATAKPAAKKAPAKAAAKAPARAAKAKVPLKKASTASVRKPTPKPKVAAKAKSAVKRVPAKKGPASKSAPKKKAKKSRR